MHKIIVKTQKTDKNHFVASTKIFSWKSNKTGIWPGILSAHNRIEKAIEIVDKNKTK